MFPQSLKTGSVFSKAFKFLKAKGLFNGRRILITTGHHFGNLTMSFILSMLLMIPLISCQGPRQNISPDTEQASRPATLLIPRWYAELPTVNGCRIAYGYGGVYLDETLQKELIVKNGSANMAKNEKVFIKAGWAGSQTYSRGLNASYIIEKGWQGRASALEKNLKIVREYRMGNGVIALCALCRDESLLQDLMNQIDDSLVNIDADDPPEWINKPTSQPEFVYGTGTAQSQIKPGKAWEEAERQARADLALTLGARHQILQKINSGNASSEFQQLSETKVEIALKDITIIRHAYSRYGKSYYVLARMPAPENRVENDRGNNDK
jgi:hypothetical protein